jgi:hypothetical protein
MLNLFQLVFLNLLYLVVYMNLCNFVVLCLFGLFEYSRIYLGYFFHCLRRQIHLSVYISIYSL